ncbi:MAG: arginase family protein, partial [Planctomycetota bacterium]|nr:arginase family protein [Planctomycetota bacterium]
MPRHSPDAFTGAGRKLAVYRDSLFVVVPGGYEGTVTYLRGTRAGPAAILDASRNMETYDEVIGRETIEDGIHCLPPSYPRGSPDRVADRLEKVFAGIFRDRKVPILLGGEHSLSLGPVRAAK